MTYSFRPSGVCSQEMRVELDDQGHHPGSEGRRRMQRQPAGNFRPGAGHARAGGHCRLRGIPVRLQAHVLPGSAGAGTGEDSAAAVTA